MRNAVLVALIVGRDDLFLEEPIQRIGIGGVLSILILHALVAVDDPAVRTVVPFRPPAVADAEMRHAVDAGLHAAGAAGFERFSRGIEPDVASLREEMRDVQIVVVDEGDTASIDGIDRMTVDLLQVPFAHVVGRVGLARKDDLHVAAR